MTTFNSHIAADQAAQKTAVTDVVFAVPDLPDQFTMKREQHISFTQKQADAVNAQIDLIERCTGQRVSVNKLIKQATLQKAEQVLEKGKK
ncbi:hypothetical protein ACYZT3_21040 [Pseudomonas sp. MDT1-16]